MCVCVSVFVCYVHACVSGVCTCECMYVHLLVVCVCLCVHACENIICMCACLYAGVHVLMMVMTVKL